MNLIIRDETNGGKEYRVPEDLNVLCQEHVGTLDIVCTGFGIDLRDIINKRANAPFIVNYAKSTETQNSFFILDPSHFSILTSQQGLREFEWRKDRNLYQHHKVEELFIGNIRLGFIMNHANSLTKGFTAVSSFISKSERSGLTLDEAKAWVETTVRAELQSLLEPTERAFTREELEKFLKEKIEPLSKVWDEDAAMWREDNFAHISDIRSAFDTLMKGKK